MDRRVRYEALQSVEEEEEAPAAHVPGMMVVVPPPVAAEEPESGQQQQQQASVTVQMEPPAAAAETTEQPTSEAAKFFEPPSYTVATSLPSYEEAERSKAEEAERAAEDEEEEQRNYGILAWNHPNSAMELGTDGIFVCTFVVAFLFNWIGLVAAVCLSRTVAGRLGAVAGFGLSMVKWVAIVKHTNIGTAHTVAADSWLWWLLILLGFLIFFRGCTQYIRLKYQWQTLSDNLRQRVYLYF